MIFSFSVVATEGAACPDFGMPKRPKVEDKPAPLGCLHDRKFLIDTAQVMLTPFRALCGILHRLHHNGPNRLHIQCRVGNASRHENLSRRLDIGQIVHGFHVIYKDRIVSSGQSLYQL